MKLTELKIRDFRCHRALDVAFCEGTTGIIGPNEAGKSSVLESIAWALYGAPALRGTATSVARRPDGKPQVVLTFEVGQETYTVERTARAAMLAAGYGGRSPMASGKSAVTEEVTRLVGMTWEEFRASHLALQGDMRRMIALRPAERAAFIRRLLGVEMLDTATQSLRKEHRSATSKLTAQRQVMEVLIKPTDDEVAAKEKELKAARATVAAEKEELEKHEARMKRIDITEPERQRQQRHDEWSAAIHRLRAAEANQRRRATMQADRAKHSKVIDDAPPDLHEAVDRAEKAMDRARKRENELDAEIARCEERASALRLALAAAEEAQREGVCVTCGRPYEDTDTDDLERQVLQARSASNEHLPVLSRAKVAKEQQERVADRAQAEHHRLENLLNAVNRAQDAVARIDNVPLGDVDVDGATKEVTTTKEAKDRAEQRLTEAKTRLATATNDRDQCARMVLIQDGRINRLEADMKTFHTQQAKWDDAAGVLKELEQDAEVHATAVQRMETFRGSVVGRIQPEMEELTTGFMAVLTDGRHELVRLDEELTPTVYEDGAMSEVVSGGTEDILALSMRLALGDLLARRVGTPVELLLLDEPFGALDEVRRSNVVSLIDRVRETYPQVVVISHVAETRDAVDHAIDLTEVD